MSRQTSQQPAEQKHSACHHTDLRKSERPAEQAVQFRFAKTAYQRTPSRHAKIKAK